MKFIHVSDLHYHTRESDNDDSDRLLKSIAEKYPEHTLIVTGDIVDDGHEEQYGRAYDALQRFAGRVFIVPGNHDFGAAGNFYSWERALRFDRMLSEPLNQGGTFTGDNTPVVNIARDADDTVMLIGLDTNLETEHPFDFACGEVGTQQLTTLNSILCDPSTATMTKMLFMHHHPFTFLSFFMELRDARELIRTIYQRVDLVLFGHKHKSNKWQQHRGVPYFIAAGSLPEDGTCREVAIEQRKITVRDVEP